MTGRHPQAAALLDFIDALTERLDQVTAERDQARDLAVRLADEAARLERWTVATDVTFGTCEIRTHHRDDCQGRPCPVHHPSAHRMADWPQVFRADRRITERTCPHGVGHPDPDDPAAGRVHGCDGCCTEPEEDTE